MSSEECGDRYITYHLKGIMAGKHRENPHPDDNYADFEPQGGWEDLTPEQVRKLEAGKPYLEQDDSNS